MDFGKRCRLARQGYDLWLDPGLHHVERLQPLLRPYPAEEITAYPVSPRVNNPQRDDSHCTEPVTDP